MFVFGVRKKENKSYDFSLIFEMKRSTLEMQYILLKEENKMKKIGVLFATVIMMMLFAVSASAETEGYYTYEVENGEATITDVDTSISGDVVIPSALGGHDVTIIGDLAFSSCDSLTSVTIPDSVIMIGNSAFDWCDSLTSITIPGSVTTIGDFAFSSCDSLKSVILSDGVTSIGDSAFVYCTSLESIAVDKNNEFYSSVDGVLFNKNKTMLIRYPAGDERSSYSIPDSVTTIEDHAFYYCTSLTSITIPDSVIGIGDYAFCYCTSLTSIAIPDSVTSIGDDAFSFCENLLDIIIGANVTEIGQDAFYRSSYYNNTSNWVDDVLYIGEYLLEANSSISDSYIIKSGTKVIANNSFAFCSNLTNVIIPESIITIGNNAFENCTFTSINIPNGVRTIGEEAFSFCQNLESVTIPSSVTSIGCGAFAPCRSLPKIIVDSDNVAYLNDSNGVLFDKNKTVLIQYPSGNIADSYTIPSTVSSIADKAFYFCYDLTSINIPNNVTTIGEYSFSTCYGLTSIHIPDGVEIIGSYAFAGCDGITSITIPGSVTSLGSNVFSDCDGIQTVTFGEGIKTTGEYTFSDCSKLSSINFAESLTVIGNSVFGNCENLRYVTIPDNITVLEGRVFWSCDNLSTINLSKNLTTIGDEAFSCTKISSIYIPRTVNFIGSRAFYGCELTYIYLPDKVTVLKMGLFEACYKLEKVELGNNVTTIERYVFNQTELKELKIPASVTHISEEAFCHGRVTTLSVDPNNEHYMVSGGVLIDKDSKTLIKASGYTNGYYQIPDGVERIAPLAFQTAYNTRSIYIPSTVKSISRSAFYDSAIYENSEYWKDDLFIIGEYLISSKNRSDKTSIIIPSGVKYITEAALSSCSNLNYVEIPEGVLCIGESAFESCEKLSDIVLPSSLTAIEKNAFSKCNSLNDLIIPESVNTIGGSAFTNVKRIAFYGGFDFTGGKLFTDVLTDVFYAKDENHWNNNFPLINNEYVKNAKVHYSCDVIDAATCITSGQVKFICTECSEFITMNSKAKGHSYTFEITTQPTHLTYGVKTYTCICGDTYTESISKIPHYYSFLVTDPTCTESGYTTCSCECGYSYKSKYVNPKGHSYSSIVTDPTCTTQGYTTYTCECGDTYTVDYINATGHSHTSKITTQPTHLTEGEETFTCACGDSYTKPIAKIAEHNYTVLNSVDPTCETEGYTMYHCECGHTYSDKKSATGHNYNGDTCVDCGESKTDNCSCNCHKGGISGFFWKIINFFNKLFKSNKTCACGVAHY